LFIILAIAVVIVLGIIAARLQYRVYQQQQHHHQQRALEQAKQDEVSRQQRERINKSIQLLAQAVQGDELTLTEASIRIAGLLDILEVSDSVRQEFSAFYQLRDLTAHIPILEGWKKLERKEQMRFDLERMKHEVSYRDFVVDAAERIKVREF
jgi:hypothetical protein